MPNEPKTKVFVLFGSFGNEPMQSCSVHHVSLLSSASVYSHPSDSFDLRTFISCSLQTRLQPLPVQTQGTQLLKLLIQVYYNNSHQQYENVTIEVSHSSMFKNHSSLSHIKCKSQT